MSTKQKWYEVESRQGEERDTFEADESTLPESLEIALQRGIPLAEWDSSHRFYSSSVDFDGPLEDVIKTASLIPVFSKKLVDALQGEGVEGFQFLPVSVEDSTGRGMGDYFVANILRCEQILDIEKSEIKRTRITQRDGSVKEWIAFVSKGFVDSSKVQGCDVARMKDYSGVWYCSEKFKRVIDEGGFTGVLFLSAH